MKVIKSEVNDAYKISFIDLSREVSSIASSVNDFVSESYNKLSGEGFTKICKNIETQGQELKNYAHYISLFDKYIMRATHNMARYMQSYDQLDDSRKEEIKATIDELNQANSYLQGQISKAKKNTDTEGTTKINVSSLEWRIASNNDDIAKLTEEYNLLEGLQGEDTEDASIITGFFSEKNLSLNSLNAETFNISSETFNI